jgi:hypothetical protein
MISLNPGTDKRFSLLQSVKPEPGDCPAYSAMGTGGFFPKGKSPETG